MALEALTLAFIILVSAVVAVVSLGRGLGALNRSVYKYHLWEIRDELWDALYDERVAPSDTIDEFATLVERSIFIAHKVPHRDLLAWHLAVKRADKPDPYEALRFLKEIDNEGPLVRQLHRQYAQATMRYVLRSLYGWLWILTTKMRSRNAMKIAASPRPENDSGALQEGARFEFCFAGVANSVEKNSDAFSNWGLKKSAKVKVGA